MFKERHAEDREQLGRPNFDVLTDDERRDGVLYHWVWKFKECDLLINYVVRKVGRNYHQHYSIGSIKALDDYDLQK